MLKILSQSHSRRTIRRLFVAAGLLLVTSRTVIAGPILYDALPMESAIGGPSDPWPLTVASGGVRADVRFTYAGLNATGSTTTDLYSLNDDYLVAQALDSPASTFIDSGSRLFVGGTVHWADTQFNVVSPFSPNVVPVLFEDVSMTIVLTLTNPTIQPGGPGTLAMYDADVSLSVDGGRALLLGGPGGSLTFANFDLTPYDFAAYPTIAQVVVTPFADGEYLTAISFSFETPVTTGGFLETSLQGSMTLTGTYAVPEAGGLYLSALAIGAFCVGRCKLSRKMRSKINRRVGWR